jgi:hypothetical protein
VFIGKVEANRPDFASDPVPRGRYAAKNSVSQSNALDRHENRLAVRIIGNAIVPLFHQPGHVQIPTSCLSRLSVPQPHSPLVIRSTTVCTSLDNTSLVGTFLGTRADTPFPLLPVPRTWLENSVNQTHDAPSLNFLSAGFRPAWRAGPVNSSIQIGHHMFKHNIESGANSNKQQQQQKQADSQHHHQIADR